MQRPSLTEGSAQTGFCCPFPPRASVEANRRERNRQNQERYRMKQRKIRLDMEASNRQLHKDIDHLKHKRTKLLLNYAARQSLWSVATTYFHVFSRGVGVSQEAPNSSVELDFLRTTMAQDVDAGNVRGVEALASSWQIFTTCFRDIRVQLESVEKIADNTLVAATSTSFTLTSSSIRYVWPHLTELQVAANLLDQRVVMRGSVRFEWDDSINRVVRLISQADMVSPMLQLLGSLEEVSLVFSDGLLTPEGNLVPRDCLKTRST